MIDCAVILAVGNPLHRSKLTHNRPRAMLPAVGKPLVVRVMNRLRQARIRHFTVIVGVNEGAVTAYLYTQWAPNVEIDFVLKSANDSLVKILSSTAKKIGKPFLLTSYNSFTHPQFLSSLLNHHEEFPNELILTGSRSTLSSDGPRYYALMEDQHVNKISRTQPRDDMSLILADLAISGHHFTDYLANLPSSTFSQFRQQFMDIALKYTDTEDAKVTIGETAWTLQVESDKDLLTLNKRLLDEGVDAHILSEIPYTVKIIPPVRIDPQVSIGQGATIGPNVYLEKGCSIGREAVISNAMILEKATIRAGDKIKETIISSRGTVIG